MELLKLVKSDFSKQKRGLLGLIILIIPLGTTAAMFLDMYIRYDDYLFNLAQKQGITSWEMLLMENHSTLQWGIFLPLFVAVISIVIYQVEFKEGGWKSLLSMPVGKFSVITGKFISIVCSSFIMISLNILGLIIVGKVIGFPEPLDLGLYSSYLIYQFAGILGVAAIHNWLSSIFKNLVIPVLIAFIALISSMIILYQFQELAKYFPYLYPYYAVGMNDLNPIISVHGGLISGGVILLMSIIEFSRRDIL